MHQPRLCVRTDVRLHAKVPLVALLAGVHLGVARFVLVLGEGGRCCQRGVHDRAGLEQQAALGQQRVDRHLNLLGKFVLFQPVAKAQDSGLVGQAGELIEPGKLAVQRGVEEGLLHCRIRQREPLLLCK